MSPAADKKKSYAEQFFYGAVTVGERGQIVIPAKARRDYGIENGDQLLIMGHPSKHGLMVTKLDGIRAFLTQMLDDLDLIESRQGDGSPVPLGQSASGDNEEAVAALRDQETE